MDLTAQTIDKMEETIDDLIAKGKISEKEGEKIIKKILRKTESKKDYLQSKIDKVINEKIYKTKKKGIKKFLSNKEMEEELHLNE